MHGCAACKHLVPLCPPFASWQVRLFGNCEVDAVDTCLKYVDLANTSEVQHVVSKWQVRPPCVHVACAPNILCAPAMRITLWDSVHRCMFYGCFLLKRVLPCVCRRQQCTRRKDPALPLLVLC